MSANDVAEAVSQGEADFGIGFVPTLEPVTVFERLFDDPLVLALAKAHPLASRDRLRWQDLANTRLILPARGTGNRMVIDDALARNATPLRWTYEVSRSTTAVQLAEQQVGAAVLPRMATTGFLPARLLVKQIDAPQVARPVGLISRIGLSDTAPVQTVIQAVRDCAAALK